MKESEFIHKNKDRWKEIETVLTRNKRDRKSDLGDIFLQVTDDLSYSRTHYPRRSVKLYLNGVARIVFGRVFRTRRFNFHRITHFWKKDLPQILYEERKSIYLSFAFFVLAILVGVLSSFYEPDFAKQILGSGYVNMTEDNILKGDPMGVYKDKDPITMFLMIGFNNLRVSVFTFVLGMLFGLGTVGIILGNGVMLGVFQYFFIQRGLFWASFLTIWQHGTIEISCIILAGGAGFTLSRGLLFPGSFPRSIALRRSFTRGMKIMLGITPLIVLAAFIESFFTRFDDLHWVIRLSVILFSLALVLGYFVIYPLRIKGGDKGEPSLDQADLLPSPKPDLSEIKTNGGIIYQLVLIIKGQLGRSLGVSLGFAVPIALLIQFLYQEERFQPLKNVNADISGNIFGTLFFIIQNTFNSLGAFLGTFDLARYYWFYPVWVILITQLLVYSANRYVLPYSQGSRDRTRFPIQKVLILFVCVATSLIPFFSGVWFLPFWLLILLPVLSQATIVGFSENKPIIRRSFSLVLINAAKLSSLALILALLGVLVLFMVTSPLIYLILDLSNEFVGFSESVPQQIFELVLVTIFAFAWWLILSLFITGYQIAFFSFREISDATQLRERIKKIQPKKTYLRAK